MVVGEGFEVVHEGIHVVNITEVSDAVIDKVSVAVGSVRAGLQDRIHYPDLRKFDDQ